jgi:hypothetical protein
LPAARSACLLLFPTLGHRYRVDGTANPLLDLPQGTAAFAQRVKMVFLIGDDILAALVAFLIHHGDALGQAAAAIACHLLEVGPTTEFFGPRSAVPVVGQPAGQPAQAVLLHHH